VRRKARPRQIESANPPVNAFVAKFEFHGRVAQHGRCGRWIVDQEAETGFNVLREAS
jgi:hypothetical protein